jgi:mannose-6-phosphate isomerase-like protein (cupin superfamily)
MSHLISTPNAQERSFVLGRELRATILTTAADTGGRHDLTECRQPAGATTPLHLHTRYEERFWVVSGSMTVWAGSEKVTLRSGDYYAIPTRVVHTIQAGPATAETELDDELFMAVTTELGDVVLGPPGMTPADLTPADLAANEGA